MTNPDIDRLCPDCGESMQKMDVPTWREFRLFGQTWLFGKWSGKYPKRCAECEIAHENKDFDRAMEAVGRDAYDQGYSDAMKDGRLYD